MSRETYMYRISTLRDITPGIETLATDFGDFFKEPRSINVPQAEAIARYAVFYATIKISPIGSPEEAAALISRLDAQEELSNLYPDYEDAIGAVKIAMTAGKEFIKNLTFQKSINNRIM